MIPRVKKPTQWGKKGRDYEDGSASGGGTAEKTVSAERVFADVKDKHGMRYTHRRGLAWVFHLFPGWIGSF